VRYLYDRIQAVMNDVSRQGNILAEERRSREAADEEIKRHIRSLIESASEQQRQRAIRGLRIEIMGFALITIGAFVQGIGSLVAALS
jgi:uncharacterized protein YaaR (DUF327 family)